MPTRAEPMAGEEMTATQLPKGEAKEPELSSPLDGIKQIIATSFVAQDVSLRTCCSRG